VLPAEAAFWSDELVLLLFAAFWSEALGVLLAEAAFWSDDELGAAPAAAALWSEDALELGAAALLEAALWSVALGEAAAELLAALWSGDAAEAALCGGLVLLAVLLGEFTPAADVAAWSVVFPLAAEAPPGTAVVCEDALWSGVEELGDAAEEPLMLLALFGGWFEGVELAGGFEAGGLVVELGELELGEVDWLGDVVVVVVVVL
jgi:hypothetical protein